MGFFRHISKRWQLYNPGDLSFALILVFVFLISCDEGSYSNSVQGGSVDFEMQVSGDGLGTNLSAKITNGILFPGQVERLSDDCADEPVSNIEAIVYNEQNNEIIRGGPWRIEDGGGRINGLSAGSNMTIVLLGRNDIDSCEIISRGDSSFDLVPGRITNIGRVPMSRFFVDNPTVSYDEYGYADVLIWDPVQGTHSYRVQVTDSDDVYFVNNPLFFNGTTFENSIDTTFGESIWYHRFRIRAQDIFGNIGAWSQF